MVGGLISNALGEGTGNGLITSALCMHVPKSGGMGKLIINATDMNYSTGARYKSTWCYGYLKNANGDKINSGQNICNTTFDEIEAGAYTIDIISAQNVKLNFQTHYEFTIKAGETKTVNLDNERYFVQYMFELVGGPREKGYYGVLNPPEKYVRGVDTITYKDGGSFLKFANYKLVIDDQIIAEIKDCETGPLFGNSINFQGGDFFYEVPQALQNFCFITAKESSIFKKFDPDSNVLTYKYTYTTNNDTSGEEIVRETSINISNILSNTIYNFNKMIKDYTLYGIIPSYALLYDYKEKTFFFPHEDGVVATYDIIGLHANARWGDARRPTQEIIEIWRNSLLKLPEEEEDIIEIFNVREYEGKLIKYDEQLCNAISDLNPQYKWVVGSYTPKYIEPYKWQYNAYTGFTYKA